MPITGSQLVKLRQSGQTGSKEKVTGSQLVRSRTQPKQPTPQPTPQPSQNQLNLLKATGVALNVRGAVTNMLNTVKNIPTISSGAYPQAQVYGLKEANPVEPIVNYASRFSAAGTAMQGKLNELVFNSDNLTKSEKDLLISKDYIDDKGNIKAGKTLVETAKNTADIAMLFPQVFLPATFISKAISGAKVIKILGKTIPLAKVVEGALIGGTYSTLYTPNLEKVFTDDRVAGDASIRFFEGAALGAVINIGLEFIRNPVRDVAVIDPERVKANPDAYAPQAWKTLPPEQQQELKQLYLNAAKKYHTDMLYGSDDAFKLISKKYNQVDLEWFRKLNAASADDAIKMLGTAPKGAEILTAYRGEGSGLQKSVQKSGAGTMFGEGKYYSLSEQGASAFGKPVKESLNFKTNEILKLDSQQALQSYVNKALEAFPNEVKPENAISKLAQKEGYKAISGFDTLNVLPQKLGGVVPKTVKPKVDLVIAKNYVDFLQKNKSFVESESKKLENTTSYVTDMKTGEIHKVPDSLQNKIAAIESITEGDAGKGIWHLTSKESWGTVLERPTTKIGRDITEGDLPQLYDAMVAKTKIDFGTTAKTKLGGVKQMVIKERPKTVTTPKITQAEISRSTKVPKAVEIPKPKTVSVPREQLPVGGGEKTVTRLEARMKSTLDNLSQETIDKLGLTTAKTMHRPEQISAAAKIVTEDPYKAMRMLEGKEELPKDLLRNSLYVAMTNNPDLPLDLATKIAGQFSRRAGQEINILMEANKDSPVKHMSEVIRFREKAIEKKHGKSVDEAVKDEVKKLKKQVKPISKSKWLEFLDEIKC